MKNNAKARKIPQQGAALARAQRTARRGLSLLALLAACGGEESSSALGVQMDFAASMSDGSFFSAPFPSAHRLVDGRTSLAGFASSTPFVNQTLALLDERADGFATTGGVFFGLEGAIDIASLPDLLGSTTATANVWLMALEGEQRGQRHPVDVRFVTDGGPLGDSNLLALLPLQGIPLQARTAYAAVVTTGVRDAAGKQLATMPALEGLDEASDSSYRQAIATLQAEGVSRDRIAGLAVFTTWDPTAAMFALADAARSVATPKPSEAIVLSEVFDNYCVYQTKLNMPVYQTGQPPYQDRGGAIDFGSGIEPPSLDHEETARLFITIPRQTKPASGWPVAVMIRTGGGGDRPLIDRGQRAMAGGQALVPGSGPALHFARAGFAGVSVDGPHGGIRNKSGGDEQFLVFNIANQTALRDNLRQSAVELALLPDILDQLEVDTSDCSGAGATASFDSEHMALMGHSMGASIAPLTLAVEPRYRAVILSGGGGSWIENIIHKQRPLNVKPLVEVLLGYPGQGFSLSRHDPFLSLLQWAGEPSDVPVYARHIVNQASGARARHILMLQGIVDSYILPPIANAMSLSLGLDLAGTALDSSHPKLQAYRPLQQLLVFSAGEQVTLPTTTSAVVQHPQDPVEDGHEVVFQTDPPKLQYQCFLASWNSSGVATIAADCQP